MKAISIKCIGLLLILFTYNNLIAKTCNGTDSAATAQFFRLGSLKISDDGQYSAVTKQYKKYPDTILIFDSRKKEVPLIKLTGYGTFSSFLPENMFFAAGGRKAKLLDLVAGKTTLYEKVKEAGILSCDKSFFILGTDGILSTYSSKGVCQKSISGIVKLVTDKNKTLLGISKTKGLNNQNKTSLGSSSEITVITSLSTKQPVELYRTEKQVKKIELTAQNTYLMITEENAGASDVELTVIDLKTMKKKSFSIDDAESVTKLSINELENGKSLWIEIGRKVFPEKTLPDIWYGNDGDLKSKHEGYQTVREFYRWTENHVLPQKITDERFPILTPIQRNDVVLAFNPRVNFKYNTRVPLPTLYLYNIQNKTYKEIFHNALETVISADGSLLLSYNSIERKWYLYDFSSDKIQKIGGSELKKPIFNPLGRSIFFESTNGLWKYDVKKNRLMVIKGTAHKKTTILAYDNRSFNSEYHIYSKTLSSVRPFLLMMRSQNNKTSYALLKNSEYRPLLTEVSNRIKDFKLSADENIGFTLEENYNLPTKLCFFNAKTNKKETLYSGNTADKEVFKVHQEVVSFTNSEGVNLKGLLYYPLDYDSKKKYPMIVHIYQVRSTDANVYYQEGDDAGFDLRTLLKKGYFVYLPDIIYGKIGTGHSALDCVNSAMDALKGRADINRKKIGLMGHSMGGYETNFIATQSKRFAAYISGSAHSDLIRNYFSYSYDTHIPQTWQIENGQYMMGVSFAEDKERYFKNSPIHYVDQVQAPILLWTGMKDENVQWEHTMEFYIGLKRYAKDVIALFYGDGYHTFYDNPQNNEDLRWRSLDWWDYFLKDKKDISWINKQMKKDAW